VRLIADERRLVFLVLAAQYESWSDFIAIIPTAPLPAGLLSASSPRESHYPRSEDLASSKH